MILNINHIVYENEDSYYISGNERIELTKESEKALTDLIDSRIDKRMNKTITINLNGYSNDLTKSLQTLNNSLKP